MMTSANTSLSNWSRISLCLSVNILCALKECSGWCECVCVLEGVTDSCVSMQCILQGGERETTEERALAPAGNRQPQPQSKSADRDRQQAKDYDSRDRWDIRKPPLVVSHCREGMAVIHWTLPHCLGLISAIPISTGLNCTRLISTILNSTRLNFTKLISTMLLFTALSSTRLNSNQTEIYHAEFYYTNFYHTEIYHTYKTEFQFVQLHCVPNPLPIICRHSSPCEPAKYIWSPCWLSPVINVGSRAGSPLNVDICLQLVEDIGRQNCLWSLHHGNDDDLCMWFNGQYIDLVLILGC